VPGEPPAPSPPVPTLAVIAPPQLVIVPPNLDTKPEVVSAWLNGDGTLDAGGVILLVVIGEDGIPIDARVLHGLGADLDATAMAAVRQWRFQPTLLNGKPVSSTATIELDFRVK
jgi:TonB family protein